MEIISTKSLTKRFGLTVAIDNISIQVNKGEIYGFLGLNGAGKTTLIRTLLGMIQPHSGEVQLFGTTLTTEFSRWNDIGYLVETPNSYPDLTVKENLKVYYLLRKLKVPGAISEIIDRLKLGEYKDTIAKNLSLGNQQRLGLAKALMHRPSLLILDEPINGLDPEGIIEVRELIKELANAGSTIFLSSHILSEIYKLATRIGIIHKGKLLRELTIEELKEELVKKVLVKTKDNKKAFDYLVDGGYDTKLTDNEIEVFDKKAIDEPEDITKLLVEKGLPPSQVVVFTEDLEKYFLRTIRNRE